MGQTPARGAPTHARAGASGDAGVTISAPSPALYDCRTVHVRLKPFQRRFSYRVRQMFLDVDAIGETAAGLRFFSYNRPGLFSFFDADHGDRSGAPLRSWAERQFAAADVTLDGGAIRLLTFPRVLGHVFNPLSIYFGYGTDGALRGVIYEVHNTFGEAHAYTAKIPPSAPRPQHRAAKRFHVSPFLDVAGAYNFTLSPPQDRLSLVIKNVTQQGAEHVASLVGARKPLTDGALLSAFLRAPWAGFGVLAAIHWQALRLWLRGARYRPKPPAPLADATIASHNLDNALDQAA